MKNLRLLTFVPALVWAFGCAPAASSSGVKKQMASMTAKEVQAKIDSRDFFIDVEWDLLLEGGVVNISNALTRQEGFLHISGNTLEAYAEKEQNAIFRSIPPKTVPKGDVFVTYGLSGYKLVEGRNGRTDIYFTINKNNGTLNEPLQTPVLVDKSGIAQEHGISSGLPLESMSYHIRIDKAGTARIRVYNPQIADPPFFGTVRL